MGCIFPPTAVVCVLMVGQAAPLAWVLKTWVPGHACLYVAAMGTSVVRAAACRAFFLFLLLFHVYTSDSRLVCTVILLGVSGLMG